MLNILLVVGAGGFIAAKTPIRVLCQSGELKTDIAQIAGKKNNVKFSENRALSVSAVTAG
jgi:hypothetical protein